MVFDPPWSPEKMSEDAKFAWASEPSRSAAHPSRRSMRIEPPRCLRCCSLLVTLLAPAQRERRAASAPAACS